MSDNNTERRWLIMECYSCNSCESCDSSTFCIPSSESRRFFTKEEKIQMLNEYKKYLEKETEGISERIKELAKD